MITAEQLEKLHISADWVDPLNQAFEKFEINTPVRQAAFIGQCQHESGNFKTLQENLNYSAESLCKVWPSRFKSVEEAQPYHRNPDKIANKVYANRMGNGDEASGDGALYKGRGLIQLTGAENYRNCGEAIGEDLLSSPDYLLSPRYAALSAAWFWHKNKLNTLADAKDWTTLTKRINGGTIGLDARIKHIEHALSVIA